MGLKIRLDDIREPIKGRGNREALQMGIGFVVFFDEGRWERQLSERDSGGETPQPQA